MNFIFHSAAIAQDNTKKIEAILDSIKNCYTGLSNFTFIYAMNPPQQVNNDKKDGSTSFTMEKIKDCNAECLCHSYIDYKGTDKVYMEMFYPSSLNPKEFKIKGDVLILSNDETNTSSGEISMSHPDPKKLLKIKAWLEELSMYCNSFPDKK